MTGWLINLLIFIGDYNTGDQPGGLPMAFMACCRR